MLIRLDQAVLEATRKLKAAGVEGARQDAGVLMTHILKADRDILYREPEKILTDSELSDFNALIDRRVNREPVAYLLGVREFWSREFIVNQHVLDPRPDTETLIAEALVQMSDADKEYRVLDLGTGSGCLILTLLAERPKATGVAIDLSADALKVAERNADKLGLSPRCDFANGPWFAPVDGLFDIIVSNPPYIPKRDAPALQPEVLDHEPHMALFAGEDGLDCYRDIISAAPDYLVAGGWLCFEVGIHQADDVKNMMQHRGFSELKITNDLASIGRCVSGRF
ncbi:MAG: peptide chain release factor N(5)-glutamine methyltransferase [Sneathiella sp.]|nr:peptide chain release factor N(5)-glutamine methyltransferase [Sneathiella sp.]